MSGPAGTLILAWGNPGRLDDGLGPALAQAAAAWDLPGVTVESGYQLQIEHAEQVARHRRVLFVDADRTGPEPFRIERLDPNRVGIGFSSHSLGPASVLALAEDLYGAEPEGWVVGIRGYAFDEFGEMLSPGALSNLTAAASFIRTALGSGALEPVRPTETEVIHV